MTTVTYQPSVVHSVGITQVESGHPVGRTAKRMLAAIEWYQRERAGTLSPCRFFPSCSEYANDAIALHGAGRGGWLTFRRLMRCRPFGPSGYDPVPERHLPAQQIACCPNHSHHEETSNV